jgi:hypothetical protein
MADPFLPDEFRAIFRNRLQSLDPSGPSIQLLGLYARINRRHYGLFVEEMKGIYDASPSDQSSQLCLLYLINEIVQKESPDVLPIFLPLLQTLLLAAAGSQDDEHIKRCKRVLATLVDRKILDEPFANRLSAGMDERAAAGADEDLAACDYLLIITHKLVHAKQARNLDAELKIRNELLDFHTKQSSAQMAKLSEIGKSHNPQPKKARLMAALGSSSDESDDHL